MSFAIGADNALPNYKFTYFNLNLGLTIFTPYVWVLFTFSSPSPCTDSFMTMKICALINVCFCVHVQSFLWWPTKYKLDYIIVRTTL